MKKFLFLPLIRLLYYNGFGQVKVACVGNSIINGTNTMFGNMEQYLNIDGTGSGACIE